MWLVICGQVGRMWLTKTLGSFYFPSFFTFSSFTVSFFSEVTFLPLMFSMVLSIVPMVESNSSFLLWRCSSASRRRPTCVSRWPPVSLTTLVHLSSSETFSRTDFSISRRTSLRTRSSTSTSCVASCIVFILREQSLIEARSDSGSRKLSLCRGRSALCRVESIYYVCIIEIDRHFPLFVLLLLAVRCRAGLLIFPEVLFEVFLDVFLRVLLDIFLRVLLDVF